MVAVIDTSSLVSLVRYYLPFDKNKTLFGYIKERFEAKEIILLDAVYKECQYTSKGIVISELEYLKERKNQVRTTELLPTRKFFNQLESQFINNSIRSRLTDLEFENRKNAFLDSADAKLILYCLSRRDDLVIVTEETKSSNDNKSFKKIPAICHILKIRCITLPELLNEYNGIDIEFK
ncbi:MAG: hypothetical protein DHS20C18_26320 [Saprospiraceae bacterium]|nr:MAG: hypothetical protein DHS20C18_26320 [Saprospiraceae bacterium]